MRSPKIEKVLDVSTAHISEMDNHILNEDKNDNPLVVYKVEYGYLIYVPDEKHTERMSVGMVEYGYSSAFGGLMDYCMENRFNYIHLDCDGEVYDDLQQFDW